MIYDYEFEYSNNLMTNLLSYGPVLSLSNRQRHSDTKYALLPGEMIGINKLRTCGKINI